MKIYSTTLTLDDLSAATPGGVYLNGADLVETARSRRFERVTIRSEFGKRRPNTGYRGADTAARCATYDEHGAWMARLFDIDPDARIKSALNDFRGRDDFHAQTGGSYAPEVVR